MSPLLDTISSYVPLTLARRIAASLDTDSEPPPERFPAATLLADISGFTRLTEQLARKGLSGEEELATLLNSYFEQLIGLLEAHGGEVVKFAGDALLALWPGREEDLTTVTLQAVQCGLTIQKQLHNYKASEDIRLSVHIGISAGEVFTAVLGGVYGRQEYLVAGRPVVEMSLAAQQAGPGQVALSPQAWKLVEPRCMGSEIKDGFVQVHSVKKSLPAHPLKSVAIPAEAEAMLRAFVPGAIVARLGAGQGDWLAELRWVSVLFINLPELDYRVSLERGQDIMRSLQTALYRYEGSINKLSVDDKGTTLVAAMGLPPLSHQDDPDRAVLAAMSIRDELGRQKIASAIGVATGRAFCGTVGSPTRREYTMIGDVVNLAARLMQAAKEMEVDILCSASAYEHSRDRVEYEALPPVMVKGRAEPVQVYRPVTPLETAIRPKTAIIGRDRERTILAEHIQALLRGSPGGVVVIEGEAGMGKSQLISDLRQQAEALHVTALYGWGDAVERTAPYHAWRGVFSQLLGLDKLARPEDRRAYLMKLLALEPELLNHAPLINPVLGLDLEDTEVTASMSGQLRAENTREFLAKLIQSSVIQSAKVIILEDAHWLDSASWALAHQVSQKVKPVLMVIATRPLPDPPPPEFDQLMTVTGAQRLWLEPLSREDTVTLVRQRFGVRSLPPEAANLIFHKAEGNPFFSEEFAFALRDAGVLLIQEDNCRIGSEAGTLSNIGLPDTIDSLITSRVDRLESAEQLTLKVASVIGRVFPYRILHDIHPLELDKPKLPAHLDTFARLDITKLETPEPDLSYIFKHIITQEVVYNMMTYAQREQLHYSAAKWYEETYQNDLKAHFSLLAHHWLQTEEHEKAVGYADKAGDEAMRNGANAEAKAFFEQSLETLVKLPETPERKRQFIDITLKLSRVSAFLPAENLPELLERSLKAGESLNDEVRVARVLGSTGAHYYMRGQMGPAFEYFGKSMVLAEKLRLEELLLLPYNLIGRGNVFSGDHVKATELLSKSIVLSEKFNDLELLAGSLVWYGVNCWFQGKRKEGAAYSKKGLEKSEELGHPGRVAIALMLIGVSYAWNGLFDKAGDYLTRCRGIAEETGDLHPLIGAYGGLGYICLNQGQNQDALWLLDQSINLAEGRAATFVPMFQVYRAELEMLAGRWQDAITRAEAALGVAQATQQRPAGAEVQRFMGRIYAGAPKPDWKKAEEFFQKSIQTHREDQRRPFVAATTYDLGKMYLKQGEKDKAHATLNEALKLLKKLKMDWYVEQARQSVADL